MFIENKYKNIYSALMTRAEGRILPTGVYSEKHHILPRCMGGTDDTSNIAVLTGREHFIAHLLLVRITTGEFKQKLSYALICFCRKNPSHRGRISVSSRWYEYSKKMISDMQRGSKNPKIGDALRGRKRSPEVCLAIGNAHRGKKVSIETRQKQSQAKLGTVASDEARSKMSAARRGIIFTAEHCANISKSYSKSEARSEAIRIANLAKRKPCTIDGTTIFNSKRELEKALGRGKNGSRSPLFKYI